jgi:hypothetical protein
MFEKAYTKLGVKRFQAYALAASEPFLGSPTTLYALGIR